MASKSPVNGLAAEKVTMHEEGRTSKLNHADAVDFVPRTSVTSFISSEFCHLYNDPFVPIVRV